MADEDPSFLGQVLAGAALRAALTELEQELPTIFARPTISRRSERGFSADALSGRIDLGRVALAQPAMGLWPITRAAVSHDTPENALVGAALDRTAEWASEKAGRFRSARVSQVFSQVAAAARRLRVQCHAKLGALRLEGVGASRLLPLAWERLALRQADPQRYRRAIELMEALMDLTDPSRQLARMPEATRLIAATLAGVNEADLQHVVFELWVASQLTSYCRSLGYRFEYRSQGTAPFAVGRRAGETVEVWWQSQRAIIDWPSPLEHEEEGEDGWNPIGLRPDLVLTYRGAEVRQILCVECKNKSPETARAGDLAQAFGYLAHYSALPACALVYRSLEHEGLFRRKSTDQRIRALSAPVRPGGEIGERLFELLLSPPAPVRQG